MTKIVKVASIVKIATIFVITPPGDLAPPPANSAFLFFSWAASDS
jgi:hypothetical protein